MSLLTDFASLATPEALGGVAKSLGVDTATLTKGLGVAAPTLLSGLAKASQTPEGLNKIMSMLPASATDDIAGLAKSALSTPEGLNQVSSLMNTAFGGGSATASRALDKAIGMPVSGLLPLAAPVLMGLIKKASVDKNLDANGVANMLQTESAAYMAQGGPTVDAINQSWASVDRLNTIKSRFDATEQAAIGAAPMAVAGLVIGSDVSAPGGLMKELTAAMQTIDAAEDKAGGIAFSDFLSNVTADDMQKYLDANSADTMLAAVSKASAAVGAKAPEQAAAYRSFLMTLANNVAGAAKEGGFLGIGAKQVTEAEAAAVARIKAAIGA